MLPYGKQVQIHDYSFKDRTNDFGSNIKRVFTKY